MRKILITLVLTITASAFAAESNISLTGGVGRIQDAGKVGPEIALSYNLGLDNYFALGLEGAFNFMSFDQNIGTTTNATGQTVATVITRDLQVVPALLMARLRFPLSFGTPYISAGAGYMWAFSKAANSGTTQYGGIAYQGMLGLAISLGSSGGEWGGGTSSAISLLIEGGYRQSEPKDVSPASSTNVAKFDASGFVARVGVMYNFGGGGQTSNW